MKKHLSLLNKSSFLLFLSLSSFSLLSQNFIWKKGTNLADLSGIYGTQGAPTTTNSPGSREYSVTWTDAAGNFWMFGGNGYDATGNFGYLSDLWKYNPVTSQWTWMKGSSAANQVGLYGAQALYNAANVPGARKSAVSFIDANGDLWLFGGYGYDNAGSFGELNDLWTYNPTTNQWRWMKGANTCYQTANYGTQGVANFNNIPGARYLATGWKDANGEFWVYGGIGYNSASNSYLNDLWKYNPSNNQWTWVKGSVLLNQLGNYGTMGTAAPANEPGARCSSTSWTDNSGNLWVIGGYGYATTGPADLLNDMWKYDVLNNQWTWMKGYSNTLVQQGTYGTQGTFATANVPGARYDAISWTDGGGDLWLFGGYGFGVGNTLDYLNDLWRYNLSTNEWKWVKGTNTVAQAGIYGLQNLNSPFNMPGSRSASATWKDNSNNLWLFGGIGYNVANNVGKLNDLWKFDNCLGPNIVINSTSNTICADNGATLTVSGASTYTWTTGQISPTLAISPSGTTSYTVYGTDANECRDTTSFTLAVNYLPVVSASSNSNVLCPNQSAILTASGAATYTWSGGQMVTVLGISPMFSTTYTVTGTDTNGCSAFATITQSVGICLGLGNNRVDVSDLITIYPNPSAGEFTMQSKKYGTKEIVIYNAMGQLVYETKVEAVDSQIKTYLARGIYTYRIRNAETLDISSGKLIIE